MNIDCDGEITARFDPYPAQSGVIVAFGDAQICITPDEARELRDALDSALVDSSRPLCPVCEGRKIAQIDGRRRSCQACDFTGLAPAEGGAR